MPAAKVWNGPDQLRRMLVPLADLQPHPSNPRQGNVEELRASLRRFGQQRPILTLPNNTIVAGHHLFYAARDEGWTHFARIASDLTDREAEAYLIADNRLGQLGGYDDALLAQLLSQQDDLTGIGYDESDLAELLRSVREPPPGDPDAVAPEPPAEPVSVPGEIYELGPHRLMCGDSTNQEHVDALLAGAAPFLMLTDPPYGVELDMEWRDRAGYNNADFGQGRQRGEPIYAAEPSYMHQRTEGHRNMTISGDTKADWSDAFELVPSLKIAYVWHASMHGIEVGQGLERIGFALSQMIVWVKPQFAMSRSHYHWQHEPCWYARRTGSPRWIGTMDQSTVWHAASPKMITNQDEEPVDHPTQKPVLLYTRPIQNHLRAGEAFYEPFGGSGTALIAAEQTGRACLAMEIDPKYCDVIRERYASFVGDDSLRP